jgi:uncharacterized protein (DUF1697 family)
MKPQVFVALLRGINVGGHNRIPMPELRALCTKAGWIDVQTFIQSGNLVFAADATPATLEAELERAIKNRFNLSIPVIVRPASAWASYLKNNPFPKESAKEPQFVQLALSKNPPKADAAKELQERAANGEKIVPKGDALWIYFQTGVGKSRLSPALFDRLVGSPVTMRNWHTVLKLTELMRL